MSICLAGQRPSCLHKEMKMEKWFLPGFAEIRRRNAYKSFFIVFIVKVNVTLFEMEIYNQDDKV